METKEEIAVHCRKCGKEFSNHPTLKGNQNAERMHFVRVHLKSGREGARLGVKMAKRARQLKHKKEQLSLLPAKIEKTPVVRRKYTRRKLEQSAAKMVTTLQTEMNSYKPQISFCPSCGNCLVPYQSIARTMGKELSFCGSCGGELVGYNVCVAMQFNQS